MKVEVKDAITIPTAASQLRKHPATPLSSTDNRQILKKNKTEDSPDRKEIRERVVKAKEKQAKYLNNLRKKSAGKQKKVHQVDDICTLTIEGNIKSVFKHLPVMITMVIEQKK